MAPYSASAPSPTRVEVFAELGSTNDEAMSRARAGEPGPLWIVAARQTAGRGRQGRSWISPEGNLHASLLLTDPSSPALAAQLGFVAGVCLIDALREATGAGERIKLKWPNDALLDGAKISGLLLEASQSLSGALAIVVGFGVNCAHHPENLAYASADLSSFGPLANASAIQRAIDLHFRKWLAVWRRGEGFADIRGAWIARAAGIGSTISVVTPLARHSGRFTGIDSAGRLVLDGDSGQTSIDAGDVFLTPAIAGGRQT